MYSQKKDPNAVTQTKEVNSVTQKKGNSKQRSTVEDNRPESLQNKRLQEIAVGSSNNSIIQKSGKDAATKNDQNQDPLRKEDELIHDYQVDKRIDELDKEIKAIKAKKQKVQPDSWFKKGITTKAIETLTIKSTLLKQLKKEHLDMVRKMQTQIAMGEKHSHEDYMKKENEKRRELDKFDSIVKIINEHLDSKSKRSSAEAPEYLEEKNKHAEKLKSLDVPI